MTTDTSFKIGHFWAHCEIPTTYRDFITSTISGIADDEDGRKLLARIQRKLEELGKKLQFAIGEPSCRMENEIKVLLIPEKYSLFTLVESDSQKPDSLLERVVTIHELFHCFQHLENCFDATETEDGFDFVCEKEAICGSLIQVGENYFRRKFGLDERASHGFSSIKRSEQILLTSDIPIHEKVLPLLWCFHLAPVFNILKEVDSERYRLLLKEVNGDVKKLTDEHFDKIPKETQERIGELAGEKYEKLIDHYNLEELNYFFDRVAEESIILPIENVSNFIALLGFINNRMEKLGHPIINNLKRLEWLEKNLDWSVVLKCLVRFANADLQREGFERLRSKCFENDTNIGRTLAEIFFNLAGPIPFLMVSYSKELFMSVKGDPSTCIPRDLKNYIFQTNAAWELGYSRIAVPDFGNTHYSQRDYFTEILDIFEHNNLLSFYVRRDFRIALFEAVLNQSAALSNECCIWLYRCRNWHFFEAWEKLGKLFENHLSMPSKSDAAEIITQIREIPFLDKRSKEEIERDLKTAPFQLLNNYETVVRNELSVFLSQKEEPPKISRSEYKKLVVISEDDINFIKFNRCFPKEWNPQIRQLYKTLMNAPQGQKFLSSFDISLLQRQPILLPLLPQIANYLRPTENPIENLQFIWPSDEIKSLIDPFLIEHSSKPLRWEDNFSYYSQELHECGMRTNRALRNDDFWNSVVRAYKNLVPMCNDPIDPNVYTAADGTIPITLPAFFAFAIIYQVLNLKGNSTPH